MFHFSLIVQIFLILLPYNRVLPPILRTAHNNNNHHHKKRESNALKSHSVFTGK